MKIAFTIGLICCLFVSTWGFWRARRTKRDCRWTRWTRNGHCMIRVRGRSQRYRRLERRRQIPARLGGAPCKGRPKRYVVCTEKQYQASMFARIVAARLDHNIYIGSFSTGPRIKKCVQDVYDRNGNVIMAGSKCNQNRRKRAIPDDLNSTQKRFKRQAVVSNSNRDILFLIDESVSVGRTNFGKFLRLAKAMVNSFCGVISIQRNATRIGVATFNKRQYPQMNFDDSFDKLAIINKMENIRYRGDSSAFGTCLADAVEFARTQMFTVYRGARPSEFWGENERVVILMTDGCGNCQSSRPLKAVLESLGTQLRRDRIPLITFLVGSNSTNCFDVMKGLAIGSQCYEQFAVPNWAGVDEISEATENNPCMDAWEIGPSCGL